MDLPEMPEGLVDDLRAAYIRPEVVAAARARLAAGHAASALEVADAMLASPPGTAGPYQDLPAAS